MTNTRLLWVLAVSLSTFSATAQEAPQKSANVVLLDKQAAEKGVFAFDYGVPSSPALRLLDQAADKVQAATNLKPFILSLPTVLTGSEDGQSVALDIAPAWVLQGPLERSYTRYLEEGRLYRILQRTHVNTAVYEGVASDDASKAKRSRLALGFSTSLLDTSDVLVAPDALSGTQSAWEHCLDLRQPELDRAWAAVGFPINMARAQLDKRRAELIEEKISYREDLAKLGPDGNPDVIAYINSKIEKIDQELKLLAEEQKKDESAANEVLKNSTSALGAKVLSECTARANRAARYGASFEVGAGAIWHGTPGRVRGFGDPGGAIWASYRLPLDVLFDQTGDSPLRYWVVGASGRVAFGEFVKTGNKVTPETRADTWDVWAGVERLTASNRLALQTGYQSRDSEGGVPDFDRERWRYLASYSQVISKNSGIWVKLAYGYVDQKGDDDRSLLISLSFAPPDPADLFGLAD